MLGHGEAQSSLNLSLQPLTWLFILIVIFVYADEVCYFHYALFGALQAISAPRRHNESDEIQTKSKGCLQSI